MTGKRSRWIATTLLALALLLPSCASGPRLYVNPDADMSYYKKIAVLPFANLSSDVMAAQRVTRAFVTELIMTDRFQIVQAEDFARSLQAAGITPGADGSFDLAKLKEPATQAGATGILRGSVTEYQVDRSGGSDIPVIAFDVELVDVNTGNVVWRSALSKRGKGRFPIFGSHSRSLGRLTQDACEEVVGRLRKEAL